LIPTLEEHLECFQNTLAILGLFGCEQYLCIFQEFDSEKKVFFT
jgi:hypothetical protein